MSDVFNPSLSSLRPTSYPGEVVSTTSSEIPNRRSSSRGGEVRAHTITRSALTPPVIKVFAPLST